MGLDLNKIATTDVASLTIADIDNGLWRLPTDAENESFTGYEYVETNAHWTTLNGVPGGMFPSVTDGSVTTFLPAAGFRDDTTGMFSSAGNTGSFWSGTPFISESGLYGFYLSFYASNVYPSHDTYRENGFAVRCVRQ